MASDSTAAVNCIWGLVCLITCGCSSALAVNESSQPVVINLSSLAGEPGKPLSTAVSAGTFRLEPGESDARQFFASPYGLSTPANQYALLRLDAGEGRSEDLFVPLKSSCVVKITVDDYLDIDLAPTPTDEQLRDELRARNPDLQIALNANRILDAAAILLDWVANHVDDALTLQDDATSLPLVVSQSVAVSYHELFRRDRGAVACGGFAVTLQKLMLLFNLDALVIDFGDTASGLTHMSVVVPQQNTDGTWSFYQFDPKLNFRCAGTTTNVPLGLFEVIDRERLGQFATVEILQGSNDARDFAGTASQQNDPRYQLVKVKGNRYLYHRPGYTLESHVNDNQTLFENGGLTPDVTGFFELMQRQFYTVRTGNNPASRTAFVNELNARKIPLIYPNYK